MSIPWESHHDKAYDELVRRIFVILGDNVPHTEIQWHGHTVTFLKDGTRQLTATLGMLRLAALNRTAAEHVMATKPIMGRIRGEPTSFLALIADRALPPLREMRKDWVRPELVEVWSHYCPVAADTNIRMNNAFHPLQLVDF